MNIRLPVPLPLLLLVLLWLLAIAAANPFGVGPLDDDWAYAWSVQQLLNTGRFVLSDWTAANLLPQVLWGALFSRFLGFSFDALRLSTVIAGLGGLVVTWGLLRQLRAPIAIAFAGTAVVAFNPIYLALSLRFMSDIPSYFLWTAALWAFCRTLQRPGTTSLALACGLGVLAILNRQSSIVIVVAYAAAELLRPKALRSSLIRAATALLVGLVAYKGFTLWLATQQQLPVLYGNQIKILVNIIYNDPAQLISNSFRNFIRTGVFHLGAMLLPFTLLCWSNLRQRGLFPARLTTAFLAGGTILLALFGIWLHGYLPGSGHIWKLSSIGPIGFGMPFTSRAIYRAIKVVLTLISIAGVLLWMPWLASAIQRFRDGPLLPSDREERVLAFLLMVGLLYYLPIAMLNNIYIFDRYLLPLLPLLMGTLAISLRRARQPQAGSSSTWRLAGSTHIIATYLILLSASYSAAITHDYMALYRARDVAMSRLLPYVNPSLVDAGWEWRGLLNGGAKLSTCNPSFDTRDERRLASWGDFVCLFQTPRNSTYKLSSNPENSFQVVDAIPVKRWLPPASYSLYILKRKI